MALSTLMGNGQATDNAWAEIKQEVIKYTRGPIQGVPDTGTWVVNAEVGYDRGSSPLAALDEAKHLAGVASQELGLPAGGHANDAYVAAAGIATLHVDFVDGACEKSIA
ncbi:MAG TPA: hypothetical protein VLF71_00175 [Candidatus Saccharimonadales bacterium]|nr:hypothetical protein [Candidatus Saccharimonadales bacterium]